MSPARTRLLPRRTVLAAALGTGLLLLPGCIMLGWEDAKFTETRTLSLAHVAGRAVDVRTENGAISVSKGQTSEVTLVAKLKATTAERLAATRIDAGRDDKGALVVRVLWPEKRKSNEGCSFELTLPDAVGVKLDSSNGSLAIRGLGGEAVLSTSNGEIKATEHSGLVHADTSNGDIVVTSCDGEIHAETSNGGITLKDVASPVKAESSNGEITLVMLPTAVGPINLGTSNGSIDVTLSPVFAGRLTADTSNGRVTFEGLDRSRIQSHRKSSGVLVFGDNPSQASVSAIDSSNGSITVRTRAK